MCKWFERWPCQSTVKRDWTFFFSTSYRSSPPSLFCRVCVIHRKVIETHCSLHVFSLFNCYPFSFLIFILFFKSPPIFNFFVCFFVLHLLFNRGKYAANMCVFFLNRLGFICFASTSCLRAASSVTFFPRFFLLVDDDDDVTMIWFSPGNGNSSATSRVTLSSRRLTALLSSQWFHLPVKAVVSCLSSSDCV